jgi:hypothetical protein
LATPVGTKEGKPVFERPVRQGFFIVVEAIRGPSGLNPGTSTFDWNASNPNVLPDFLIVSSLQLGNGSTAVCDDMPPSFIGGVPAVNPPAFGGSQFVANAINDFSCRFSARTNSSDACTRTVTGDFGFVSSGQGLVQFCPTVGVGVENAFPVGETTLTAIVKDVFGQPGLPASIIVRVTGQ